MCGVVVNTFSYVHTCTCPLTFLSLCVPPVVPSAPQEATTCTASDPSPHPQPPTPAPGMGMGCGGSYFVHVSCRDHGVCM